MTATADQLTRLGTARFDFQMRFYTGGKRDRVDLSLIGAGGPYDPTAATTLAVGMVPADIVVQVADASAFPASGTILIAPQTEGEEYELIAYDSRATYEFQDITRGAFTGPASGYHTAGAAVTQWIDITALVYSCELSVEERDGIVAWTATLTGHSYNSRLLDNDNSCLAMWRFRPLDGDFTAWTAWTVAWVGYVKDCSPSDEYRRSRRWQATVEGISQYLDATDCPAHSFGRTDLARDRTTRVSSTLSDLYLERASGEYIGSPDVGGDKAVDGDINTLWISDEQPAATAEAFLVPTYPQSAFSINEVYLQSPPGLPALQWIEIAYKSAEDEDGNMGYYALASHGSHWSWADAGHTYRIVDNHFIDLTHGDQPSLDQDGGFGLIVSNRARFEERYSVRGCGIVDWRDREVGAFSISPAGDLLAWHFYADSRSRESVVWFGTINPHDYTGDTANNPGSGWTGGTIPIPPLGHSFRRSPANKKTDPDMAANFIADEDAPTPGYHYAGDPEFLSVDLGELGIHLEAILTAVETGEAVLSATLGLTESGDVMIDGEIVGYSARDDTNDKLLTLVRGKYGTTPAEHPVDSVVKPYEAGIAYTAPLIASVLWRRRPVQTPAGSFIVPRIFTVYISTSASPIYPDDADWDDEWADYWTIVQHAANWREVEWQFSLATPLRARHVMLAVQAMTDGGRVKLNEFHVYAATLEVAGGGDPIDGAQSGTIIKSLLVDNFGLAPAQFTLTDEGSQFDSLDTTKGRYSDILRDLLRRTGCWLILGLDETVEHRFSPFYPVHGIADVDVTWTRANARSPVEMSRPFRHNVSQVVLRARALASDSVFEVRYPPTPLPTGSELTLDDMIVGSVTDALLLAEQTFRRRNGQIGLTVSPVGPGEWIRPGDRHVVSWDLDAEGVYLSGCNFVVQGVNYAIDFGRATAQERREKSWSCTVRLQELTF